MPVVSLHSSFRRVASVALGAAVLLGAAAQAQEARLDPITGEDLPGVAMPHALADAGAALPARAGADLTLVGRLADGETRGFALVGDVLYRSNGGYLEILNVADPAASVVLGRFPAEQGIVQGASVLGSLAFVPVSRGTPFSTRGSLQIVDVSDPARPLGVGQVAGRSFFDAVARGTTVYTAAGTGGLRIYDVSTPAAPVAQGVATVSGGSVLSVALGATTAYLAAGAAGLAVVDVANPAAPVLRSTLALGDFATRVAVVGTRAYVSVNNVGLVVVDVSVPAAPVEIGRFSIASSQVRSVAVNGTTAYVGDDRGFNAVDVSSPAAPVALGRVDFGQSGSGQYIVVDGGEAYVSSRYQGVRVLDVTTPTPTVRARIDNGGFSFKVNVVDGIAYVADLLGQVRLVDVSNPAAPRELGRVQGIPNADAVEVAAGIAYVADRGGAGAGLTRVDVSNPAAPVVLSTVATGGAAYGLDLDGSTLYVANGYGAAGSGPGSVLSAAVSPTGVAFLDEAQPGNQAFDVRVAGGRAYVATFGSGLSIFDVSNPAVMTPLSLAAVGNFASAVEVDGTTVYLADSQVGSPLAISIIDASNPSVPVLRASANAIQGGTAVDVGLGQGYAYAAVDFVGLYQFDVTNPAAPARRETVTSSDRATGVDVEGRTVVLADAGAGLWVFQTPLITSGEGDAPAARLAVAAAPNPTAGAARVQVSLPAAAEATVEVFSVLGRRVARLDAGALDAGTHVLALDAGTWAPGVYVVRLMAGGQTVTSRLTVAR